jgi:hypothetical protein
MAQDLQALLELVIQVPQTQVTPMPVVQQTQVLRVMLVLQAQVLGDLLLGT